jgi:hypothetical protein
MGTAVPVSTVQSQKACCGLMLSGTATLLALLLLVVVTLKVVVAVTVMVRRSYAEGITFCTTLRMEPASLEGDGQLRSVNLCINNGFATVQCNLSIMHARSMLA